MFFFLMRILLVCGLLCLATEAHARNFQRVGESNGLNALVIASVLVDRDGYLWVGSREGLYRYDGYDALTFPSDPKDLNTLSDTDIRYVFQARDGTIWVSTNSGGLNRYEPVTGHFKRYRHDSNDPASINDDNVYSIEEDSGQQLWIATEKGVARMDVSTGRFERFTHDPEDGTSLSNDRAYALYRSPRGVLWVATLGGGINRWNVDSQTFTRFDLAGITNGPAELNDVFAIRESPDERLWIGTRGGLLEFDAGTGSARQVDLGVDSGEPSVITYLDFDRYARLWIGSLNSGIFVLDPASGKVETATLGQPGGDGNVATASLTCLEINGDDVFAGTWGQGIYHSKVSEQPFELLRKDSLAGMMPNETISAVEAGSEPGRPWLGTFGAGVLKVNVEEHKVEQMVPENDPMYESGVLEITAELNGLRLAATSRGLFTFDESGKTVTLQGRGSGQVGSLGPGYVFSALLQDNGDLWVGVGGSGLYLRRAGSERLERFTHEAGNPASLSGDFITRLLEEAPDMLLVGTRSNGLNRCSLEPWHCDRFDGRAGLGPNISHFHVTDLYRSRRGRLWVATGGGGLNEVVIDRSGAVSAVRSWTEEDGLLSNTIMAIAEDADESLWLSTRHGLSRLDPDTGEVVNHVTASGLPVSNFNSGAADADDRYIYFGSANGLLVIRKGSSLETRSPSPVRTTQVQTTAKGAQLESVSWRGEPIMLPYGQVLSLAFAVMDFSESPHEYAYRLDTDDKWIRLGARRDVTFFGLAPGHYKIQARGRDVFGLWGESEIIDLRVLPPFWMQTWFRVLIAMLVILLAVGLHRARLARERSIAREARRLSEKRESALEAALGSEAELAVLTPRQKEVLQLLAEGYTAREIGELLDVSIKTVQAHRANLMERLDIADLPGLVRLAIRTGIVSSQDK